MRGLPAISLQHISSVNYQVQQCWSKNYEKWNCWKLINYTNLKIIDVGKNDAKDEAKNGKRNSPKNKVGNR